MTENVNTRLAFTQVRARMCARTRMSILLSFSVVCAVLVNYAKHDVDWIALAIVSRVDESEIC